MSNEELAKKLSDSLAAARAATRIVGSKNAYKRDNPGEYAKVMAYLDGGPRPTGTLTQMGTHLVLEEDVRVALLKTQTISSGTPLLPQAPTTYSIPGSAFSVDTTAELISALSTQSVIVMEDGTYDHTTYITLSGASRAIYARNPGGAVCRFGWSLGGSGGHILRGLDIRLATSGATAKFLTNPGSHQCVYLTASDCQLLDLTLDGLIGPASSITGTQIGGWLHRGVFNGTEAACDGLVMQRLRITNFNTDGVMVVSESEDNETTKMQTVTDIDVSNVSYMYNQSGSSGLGPGGSSGTGEGGVCLGAPVIDTVARLRTRDCAVTGFKGLQSMFDTNFTDLTLEGCTYGSRIGTIAFYAEYRTKRNVFSNCYFGPHVNDCCQNEWDRTDDGMPTPPGYGASHDNTIQDSTLDANIQPGSTGASDNPARATSTSGYGRIGVFADEGTVRLTVKRSRFLHCNSYCILNRRNLDSSFPTTGPDANDFSGSPGATPVLVES